ncbi:MAG: thioredoxin domain-containing protein [Gammaproteobacteria bacterium]|nr:thioredoxin domain-containing protein [Gammaproteobacteria bacterium]
MKKSIWYICCLLPLVLLGCKPADTPMSESKSSPPLRPPQAIAAKVSGNIITIDQLDQRIELKLFDLEWRKYQLRRAALDQLLSQQLSSDGATKKSIEITLKPPSPPRISLPRDSRLVKGDPSAKVRLSLFCSYQSSHCARLQPIITELELRYQELIHLVFYDQPQPFHRFAKSAANAAHCAEEQGKPWQFQAALYADINDLNQANYQIIAQQLSLDEVQFSECLEHRDFIHLIDDDLKLGQQLGLGNVPVLFINGLYAKGPQTVDSYGYYINQELMRLGLPIPSTLPIELIATSVVQPAAASTATVKYINNQQIVNYQRGDLMQMAVKLDTIEPRRIIVLHQGRLEFIRLKQKQQALAIKDNASAGSSAMSQDQAQPKHPEQARELPSAGQKPLSREWLDTQLAEQQQLAQYFHPAAHQIDGVHLLKLQDIEQHPFFKTLGLQSGDVILQVNEQWVSEQSNPLWQNLSQQDHIKLLLMRNGLPIRYDYQVHK